MQFKNNSNNKLIIILLLVSIFFVVVLTLLYFTFGKSSVVEKVSEDSVSQNATISSIRKLNQFDNTDKVIDTSPSSVSTSESTSTNSKKTTEIASSTASFIYEDIVNKDLKLPEMPKIEFKFEAKDKDIISKYIKTDFENKITAILKDDKNSPIVAFKIPKSQIDSQTQKDYPNTFKLSNEDRKTKTDDSIFLYYTAEQRLAYLGEYIEDIKLFEYQSQNYWLILYNFELIISKPNFSNWKMVYLQDDLVESINKKSEFEFEILKILNFENYEEYKIEVISPQKYIIDGIFNESGGA